MQWNLKKMWPALATSAVAFTSLVDASTNDNAQMRNLENRVTALEQRKGAGGVINPPARPQVRGGADLFVYGDLLVWNAHQNGMPVGVRSNSSTSLAKSDIESVHGKWKPGFRAGIGYNTPHDGWDLSLTWLRYYTTGTKRFHAGSNHFIFPSRAHPKDPLVTGNASFRKAHSHWNMHLNQIDFDLGREFFVSKWLTVRPHFGLRTDWIWQLWRTNYINSSAAQFPNEVKDRFKDHWWGIGAEGGLDTLWGLGGGWGFYGDITGAIIYGFHDMHFKDRDKPANTNFVKTDWSYRISHAILDIELGLRWDHMFDNDRFHLGLHAGWENHVYFSQNQFPVFVDDFSLGTLVNNQGDLTFQGWTFGARFDF